LAACQLDTEGGMSSVYILHSCIIVKPFGYISLLFMYWILIKESLQGVRKLNWNPWT